MNAGITQRKCASYSGNLAKKHLFFFRLLPLGEHPTLGYFSVTPTLYVSSSTTSMILLCDLPIFLFPGSSTLGVFIYDCQTFPLSVGSKLFIYLWYQYWQIPTAKVQVLDQNQKRLVRAIPNQIKLNQFSWMKSTTIHAYNTAMISFNAVTFARILSYDVNRNHGSLH